MSKFAELPDSYIYIEKDTWFLLHRKIRFYILMFVDNCTSNQYS